MAEFAKMTQQQLLEATEKAVSCQNTYHYYSYLFNMSCGNIEKALGALQRINKLIVQ